MVVTEELYEKKRRALAKARREKSKKQMKARHDRTWDAITRLPTFKSCNCGLRKGMTLADLRELGAGCTNPRYVCPVLDSYRRKLEH